MEKHIINCDANPFVPEGWTVEEHQKGGQFEWDPKKVQLWITDRRKIGKYIWGETIREEVANKTPFNANVLDYLFAHPELIPEEWKDKCQIHFWGTIYRDLHGNLCVRCLGWGGTRWSRSNRWIHYDWLGPHPTALRKN